MIRIPVTPRPNWQTLVESQGLTFHTLDLAPGSTQPQPYWDESAAYEFTAAEIDTLEAAANQLQGMCLAAAQHVIDHRRYADLGIPAAAIPVIEAAWNAEPPALYGRFDIMWAGAGSGQPPKLLEYNADTPTSLLEAAVIQWNWLEDFRNGSILNSPSSRPDALQAPPPSSSRPDTLQSPFPSSSRPDALPPQLSSRSGALPPQLSSRSGALPFQLSSRPEPKAEWRDPRNLLSPKPAPKPDQFNSIHERLVAKWRDLMPYLQQPVYFAGVDTPEDTLTLAYLEDTAQQAGLSTRRIPMLEIGWNEPRQCFVDLAESQIQTLFKLYPWETMLGEDFGPHALRNYPQLNWIEPIWKLLLSNKGILPILWELYPNHPNLLESHFDSPGPMSACVRKPLFSREGENISLTYADGTTVETPGTYADSPETRFIFQALAPPATFPNARSEPRYPVIGLWMIDQECAGMGIRESPGPITGNRSSFVPHLFR